MRRCPGGHDDCLRVVRNHSGHEVDIGVAVCLIDPKSPLLGRGRMNGLWIVGAGRNVACKCATHARRICDNEE